MPDRFDHFTEAARQVLSAAQQEAQRHRHNYMGTEHLLLGLLHDADSVAGRALGEAGVTLEKARAAVEHIIGWGAEPPPGALGLTPRAKRVIELAVDEARRLNHQSIDTAHLLLGLMDEGEGIAAGVLAGMVADLGALRGRVVALTGATDPGPARSAESSPANEVRQLMRALTARLQAGAALAADAETRLLATNLHALLGRWLDRQGQDDE